MLISDWVEKAQELLSRVEEECAKVGLQGVKLAPARAPGRVDLRIG